MKLFSILSMLPDTTNQIPDSSRTNRIGWIKKFVCEATRLWLLSTPGEEFIIFEVKEKVLLSWASLVESLVHFAWTRAKCSDCLQWKVPRRRTSRVAQSIVPIDGDSIRQHSTDGRSTRRIFLSCDLLITFSPPIVQHRFRNDFEAVLRSVFRCVYFFWFFNQFFIFTWCARRFGESSSSICQTVAAECQFLTAASILIVWSNCEKSEN